MMPCRLAGRYHFRTEEGNIMFLRNVFIYPWVYTALQLRISYTTAIISYSASVDIVTRNCHFPTPGSNCMTRRQALRAPAA
jgi:hypothetical protein